MTLLPAAITSPTNGRLILPSLRILCTWSISVSSANESLSTSPGESLTGVWGPGGFGKGGSGAWQLPNMSIAKTTRAKRREEERTSRLRLEVPGNVFRLPHGCMLVCAMERGLLHNIAKAQDKYAKAVRANVP